MFAGLKTYLVWDGDDTVRIPTEMGTPKPGQMEGTTAERLTELAGRVCYDSLGVGRSSADYFDHILGVGHLSIAEHFQITLKLTGPDGFLYEIAPVLFNRPGVWVAPINDREVRLTLNPRTAFEWDRWSAHLAASIGDCFDTTRSLALGTILRGVAHGLAPRIVAKPVDGDMLAAQNWLKLKSYDVVAPLSNDEKWITVYMVGSRGFSHEQVRHGDFTAISQRSTRYCDESESPWVIHPLIQTFIDGCEPAAAATALACVQPTIDTARQSYVFWVDTLQKWLTSRGVDKVSSRKQARGAARGFLGNALETEVIFSASVAQWRHMFRMRAANAADAEIRGVFSGLLPLMKKSRYGESFADMDLATASDGIGMALSGGGAK